MIIWSYLFIINIYGVLLSKEIIPNKLHLKTNKKLLNILLYTSEVLSNVMR